MKHRSLLSEYLPLIGIFIVFAMSVCRAADPFFIKMTILGLLLATAIRKKVVKIQPLDLCVILIWLYEVVLQFTTVNSQSSLLYLYMLTQSVCFYGILRLLYRSEVQVKRVLICFSFFILILSLVAISSFFIFKNIISQADFSGLYNFRFMYKPLGNITNEWGSIQIYFLSIIALTIYHFYKNRIITLCLIICILSTVFVAFTSFSRGVYVAIMLLSFIFIIALFISKINAIKKIAIILSISIAMWVVIFPIRSDMNQTLRMTESVSQQRSIDSRISTGSTVVQVIKDKPIFGVGSGNFSMVTSPFLYEDDNVTFTDFTYSILYQVIVEKGFLGFVLWLFLISVVVWMLFRKRESHWQSIIIFSFFIAIFIRELTFPILFSNLGAQLIVFMLLAFYQNNNSDIKKSNVIIPNELNAIFFKLSVIVISGTIIIFMFARNKDLYNYNLIRTMIIGDKMQDAKELLCSDNNTSIPYLLNHSTFGWHMYKETKDTVYLALSEKSLRKAVSINPYDIQLQYRLIVSIWKQGRSDTAIQMLYDLTERFPNKALYRFTLAYYLHTSKKLEEAIPHYASAIKLAPRIMNTEYWSTLRSKDIIYCRRILKDIKKVIYVTPEDPILCAKYGQIMMNIGDLKSAKKYLTNAIDQLPNLAHPWYLLSIIARRERDKITAENYHRKASILLYGDIANVYAAYKSGKEQSVKGLIEPGDVFVFLSENYTLKSISWYSFLPYITDDYY